MIIIVRILMPLELSIMVLENIYIARHHSLRSSFMIVMSYFYSTSPRSVAQNSKIEVD